MRLVASLGCCVVCMAFGGPAHAQAPEPDQAAADSADARARVRFEMGRAAYADGRFEDAYEQFQQAYALSPRPELMFNVAQAADRLGLRREAVDGFRAYLRGAPDASNRAYVEARIRVLEEEANRESWSGADAEPAGSDGDGARWGAWVAAGVAAVAAAGAIYFWVDANDRYDGLEQACGARGCSETEIDGSGVETAQTLTWLSLGVGLAATTAAVVLFALGGDEDDGVTVEATLSGARVRHTW